MSEAAWVPIVMRVLKAAAVHGPDRVAAFLAVCLLGLLPALHSYWLRDPPGMKRRWRPALVMLAAAAISEALFQAFRALAASHIWDSGGLGIERRLLAALHVFFLGRLTGEGICALAQLSRGKKEQSLSRRIAPGKLFLRIVKDFPSLRRFTGEALPKELNA